MFDPNKIEAIQDLEVSDLASLPPAEDDRHEYKSSATKDGDLADKIARAASGFWNSGGGLFVAGVDGSGQPDDGILLTVGRQSRRDWIDQTISRVTPIARYSVRCIEGKEANGRIRAGNGVVLIGFAPSEVGPHMAPDNRYYIRAGAHTVAATHFIVDAIYARRGLRTPLLRHVFRVKPDGNGTLQLGILCLNDSPALDVEISFDPPLQIWGPLSLCIPVVSPQAPFYLDFHEQMISQDGTLRQSLFLKYRDLANTVHQTQFDINPSKQVGPQFSVLGLGNELRDVERAIRDVADAIKNKR